MAIISCVEAIVIMLNCMYLIHYFIALMRLCLDASIRIFGRRMMEGNKRILKNRKSARRKDWDYARPGEYFIATNTKNFYPFFGRIEFGEMILN